MSIPSLSDISSVRGIKRTAYVLKSKSSHHAALGMVIYELKAYHDELLKFVNARTNVMSAILKWVTEEENFAMKDVFNRMAELEWLWSRVMHDLAVESVDFRKAFKTLLAEEKSLDEHRKTYANAQGKVEKVTKQVENLRGSKSKKPDKAKSEALDAELATVLSREEETGAALDSKERQLEVQKASSIREAIVTHTKCQLSVSEKIVEINKAHCELVKLIPTQSTKEQVYTGLEESERIVHDVTTKLGADKAPCSISDPGYSPVYQSWTEQPTDPPLAPPTAIFYTPQTNHGDTSTAVPNTSQTASGKMPRKALVPPRNSYTQPSGEEQPPRPPPRPASMSNLDDSKTSRKATDKMPALPPEPCQYMELIPGPKSPIQRNLLSTEDSDDADYQSIYEDLSIYDNAGAPAQGQPKPVQQRRSSSRTT